MITYSRRPAGHSEPIATKQYIDTNARAAAELRPTLRAAAPRDDKPAQPSLRWTLTEQGLRMSWEELPAGSR